MNLDLKYYRSFRLGKLYFRFIKDTILERQGWTSETLAIELERAGFIKIVTVQLTDSMGRFKKPEKRYVELPGKAVSKRDFFNMLAKQGVKKNA